MKNNLVLFFILLIGINTETHSENKIGKNLALYLKENISEKPMKVWIYFYNKGNEINKFFNNPTLVVSKESLERRKKVLPAEQLIDYQDLPVNEDYLNLLREKGIELRYTIRWFNSVSAIVTPKKIYEILDLPFIKEIELVEKFKKRPDPKTEEVIEDQIESPQFSQTSFNYGSSLTQNQQINVVAVHNTGNYGQGVRICLMDAGFNRLSHEVFQNMQILATYDFVNNRPYVGDGQGGMGEGSHGTQTLSTIGGFKEGQLIGPAFGAMYILAKTENTESETPIEMDNWIRALEWADSIGVDVTSTSLGYLEFDPPYQSYTWQDMDGNTVPITIAADLAVKRGIVVVNSAGNEGYNATHNTLVAPADGDSVIAVGAVNSSGQRTYFSSVGNTVDGRIKPDVMAMGSGVRVASPYSDNGYTSASGTSFSCPLAAGVAALILSENPSLTPMQVRDAMRNTANNSLTPNREYGWGILNALEAVNYYNIKFEHTPPVDSFNLDGPYRIAVKITSRLGVDAGSVKLFWGRGTITDSLLMNEAPGDSFIAFIPGNGTSAVYKYYFIARTADGQIVKKFPKYAPQEVFEFRVGSFASLNVNQGWNLISLPVNEYHYTVLQLFNDAISNAYYYDGGYITKDTLVPGRGFWLKFNSTKSYLLPGQPLTGISIPVKQGWNLIGSLSTTIPVYSVQSNPNGIILTPFYGYNGGYFNSPNLEKGKGYWVKVSQDGYLILNSTYKQSFLSSNDQKLNSIEIIDAKGNRSKLYLGNLSYNGELPPVPPDEIFDIRFIDSKINSESETNIIRLQSVTFPIIIKLNSIENLDVELYDIVSNVKLGEINNQKDLRLDRINGDKILIKFSKKYSFDLKQNYPNPFNPETEIQFSIPYKTMVTLKIYDILGQELATLVDEELERGSYTYKFDVGKIKKLSSNILIYQMKSGDFIKSRKMIYLK